MTPIIHHPDGRRGFATISATLLLAVALAPAVLACDVGAAGTSTDAPQTGKTAAANAFDGERAMMYARDIVAFGPRPAGSDALEQTRRYIEAELAGFGLTVERDEFVGDTPVGDIPMANLIAHVPAAEGAPDGPVIIFSGHYDTLKRDAFDFVGANDAGSSTAILLEFGRVLAENPPPLPMWLVFFDGEEALVSWSSTDSRYGSRHMVQRMQQAGELDQIGVMILFDMIGDADLRFSKDGYSTDWVNDVVWDVAAQIGHSSVFATDRPRFMEDDHTPFVAAGVAAIDLIDFDFGPGNRYWHAPFDTYDKLGASSFQAVGETALSALPVLAERLLNQ